MRTKTFNIKIENPCAQKWDEMKIMGDGRYCSHCTKVVIDFNSMTDKQVADFLMKQSSSVCGRISKTRTQTPFHYPSKNTSRFNFSLLRYSLAGFLTFASLRTFSQSNKNKTEQIITDDSGKKKVIKQNKITDHKNILMIRVKTENGNALSKSTLIHLESGTWHYEARGNNVKIPVPDSLMKSAIAISVHSADMESHYSTIDMNKNKLQPVTITLYKQEQMIMGLMALPPVEDSTK